MSAVERFIEELGLISQESGDARIAGRLLGLLVTEGRELSLGQISERLAVSRASVSTNARLLAQRGVINLVAHAGDRQDYYVISDVPYADMLREIARQFHRNARRLQAIVDAMARENAGAAGRAGELSGFFEKSAEILSNWADELRDDPEHPKGIS